MPEPRDAASLGRGRPPVARRVLDWLLAIPPPPEEPPPPGVAREPEAGRVGICCSGGGIRSAAYNLGALQVLEAEGVLGGAAYLSAVSGGSYIAAAFTMARTYTDPGLLATRAPFAPGSPEETYLRDRTDYLAPGAGGKAALLERLVLGFAVNLVFIWLFLYAVGRPTGWLLARWYPQLLVPRGCPGPGHALRACFRPVHVHPDPMVVAALGGVALGGLALVLLDVVFRLRRERLVQVVDAWSARLLVLAAIAFAALVALPQLVVVARNVLAPTRLALAGGGTGSHQSGGSAALRAYAGASAVATIGAVVLHLRAEVGPWLATGRRAYDALRRLGARSRQLFVYAVAAVVGPAALVAGLVWIANDASAHGATAAEVRGWVALVAVLGALYASADLTAWSMHPFYRRRLCSAFAVKRTSGATAAELPYREPVLLSRQPPGWPELLVCAAVNVSDRGLTPPGFPVDSFVLGTTELGGPLVGVVPTDEFEDALGPRVRDVTLPAAVAMSGAAISPSMGKMTRAPLRFLLTVANARLGVWVPNPRSIASWAARGRAGRIAHRPRPVYLVKELLGRNRVHDAFLYVTDGGHYENLGLVELLRRGCTEIYCFDASGDDVDSFFTLGQAVALARTQLEVAVSIDPSPMRPPDGTALVPTDHVVGTFRFRGSDATGTIVFAKAGVTADAPWDVLAYREKDPRFPTHSTVEQLYTDERFEAYRALGAHTAANALRSMAANRPHPRPPGAPRARR